MDTSSENKEKPIEKNIEKPFKGYYVTVFPMEIILSRMESTSHFIFWIKIKVKDIGYISLGHLLFRKSIVSE